MIKVLTDRQKRMYDLLKQHGGTMQYEELAQAMYPPAIYPDAWHSATRGGAPGCYMSLSKMIATCDLQVWGPEGTKFRQVALPEVVPPDLALTQEAPLIRLNAQEHHDAIRDAAYAIGLTVDFDGGSWVAHGNDGRTICNWNPIISADECFDLAQRLKLALDFETGRISYRIAGSSRQVTTREGDPAQMRWHVFYVAATIGAAKRFEAVQR